MFSSHLRWKVPWLLLAARVVKFKFISLHVYGAEQYYLTADMNLIFYEKGKTYPLHYPPALEARGEGAPAMRAPTGGVRFLLFSYSFQEKMTN